jgi:TadE-like protein
MTRRRRASARRASAGVEFALVASCFFALVLFILDVSLLFLGKGALQMAAAQTARCTAIGAPACASAQTFAASLIGGWGAGGILPSLDVSVQSGTSCNGVPGQFSVVTISSPGNATLQLGGLLASAQSASACYPSAP